MNSYTKTRNHQKTLRKRQKTTIYWNQKTLKSTSVSVCFREISRLPSSFVFLRWFKLAHISIQVCTFHDGCKQGIDQQIFNRKLISRKITHPQSLFNRFYLNKDWGCVILREMDFLLKICWSIPCFHPSWKVHTWNQKNSKYQNTSYVGARFLHLAWQGGEGGSSVMPLIRWI